MEALDRKNRQSGILSIINHEKTDRSITTQSHTSATMATAIMSPTHSLSSSIYSNGPPPPYSSSWTPGPPSIANLISPPEPRRTSDIKHGAPPHLQTTRQTLPSIQEALNSTHKQNTYTSPVSTSSAITPHQASFSQPPGPSTPRSYPPPDHIHYAHASQPRQPSPPRSIYAEPKSFSQPSSRPTSYVEAPRHPSITSLPPPGPHNQYAPSRYEQMRYEPEARIQERPPNGYSYNHLPQPQQQTYTFGTQPSPSALSPTNNPSRYPGDGQDVNEPWKATREAEKQDPVVGVRQGIKRHLEVWDFENTLSEINVASSTLHSWSDHYNAIASEQQRSANMLPDRMPSMESVNDMIMQNDRIRVALDRMKEIIPSQQRSMMEQRAREIGGRPGEYDEDASMFGDDMKGQGFGSEGKKKRGRAAPPGRCHSCNRAETPEWRRGPDGARTLCNACGLHYAKLTRKNTMKQSQGLNGSSLRPKSIDDVPQRPL